MHDFLTDLQQQVFNEAKRRLRNEPWFCGICGDDFPVDADILADFEGSVTGVMFATAMWDDPNFLESLGDVTAVDGQEG